MPDKKHAVNRSETPTLESELAGRLQQPRPTFSIEHYGPDGEIEEVWVGDKSDPDGMDVLEVVYPGGAMPNSDWRERGVVPPKGIHPLREDRSDRGA